MIGTSFPGLPELASAHGGEIDQLIGYIHWLMFALFFAWGAFFLYLLVRFRQKRNPRADYRGLQTHVSSYGEVGVAVAEAILLIGFSIPLWSDRVDALPPEDEAVVARVIAEQFAWNVHYPGPDGLFGSARVELVDVQTNPIGLDPRDPAGADDVVVLNQLHLPVGRPAILHLSAKDVIHSLGVPEMRIKQDAIPGLTIPVWFTPTMTTAQLREKTGRADAQFELVCNQLCGIGHYRMKGFLTVETEEEFQAWLESRAPVEGSGDDFWG